MKERIISGVEIACENYMDGDVDFEGAVKFIEGWAQDPSVTLKIARQTMNYFRTTKDLVKTKDVIMKMRKVEFDRLQEKEKKKAVAILTRAGETLDIDFDPV